MKIATQKQVWTEQEWREYIRRLCRIREILYEFVFEMPLSAGLRSKQHLKPLMKAHGSVVLSMKRLENTIAEQLGGEACVPGGVIAFVRGRQPGMRSKGDLAICFVKGNARSSDSALSPEEWMTWGDKAKEATKLIADAVFEAKGMNGSDIKRHIKALLITDKHLLTGRARLDDLVSAQYPEWPDAFRVFFGSRRS